MKVCNKPMSLQDRLNDKKFFGELTKTRRDHRIRKGVANDISRRRIAVIEINGVNKLR